VRYDYAGPFKLSIDDTSKTVTVTVKRGPSRWRLLSGELAAAKSWALSKARRLRGFRVVDRTG